MPIEGNRNCGCKGIRKCLLCEESGEISELQIKQAQCSYTFCPHCGLCWPDRSTACEFPLYLGEIKVFENFVTEDEEALAVSEIDKISWMPSQSGRRKQDFGPKVNFKKKKVKIGNFKGFPSFANIFLRKFKNLFELSDFQPVELCHLEYSPERGSSIDPHVDDFWLWGERLVTVNLLSSTIFTLLPFSDSKCECLEDSQICFSRLDESAKNNQRSNEVSDNAAAKCFLDSSSSRNCIQLCQHNDFRNLSDNNYECQQQQRLTFSDSSTSYKVRTFCSTFRLGRISSDISIRVELPPRSLLVLAGCARYNWYHEIKRKDVVSRRLAMTFRELSPEFLPGGRESEIGQDLLSLASNFCDFS